MGKTEKRPQLSATVPQPPPGARLVAIRHKGKTVKPVRSVAPSHICQRYIKDGTCPFGEQCPFKHPSKDDAKKLAESSINIKSHLERRRAENVDVSASAVASGSDISIAAKEKALGEISELERKLAELKKQLTTLEEQTKQNDPIIAPTPLSRSVSPEPQPAPEALAAVKQDAFKRAEMRKERRLEMAPYKEERKRGKKDKKKKKKKKKHRTDSADESEEWPEGVYPIENLETGILYDGEHYRPCSEWLTQSAPQKVTDQANVNIEENDVKQEQIFPTSPQHQPESVPEVIPVKDEPISPPIVVVEKSPPPPPVQKRDSDRKRKRDKESKKERGRERDRKEKDKRDNRKHKKSDRGKESDRSKKKSKARKGDRHRKEAEKIIKGDITFEISEEVSSTSEEDEAQGEEEKDDTLNGQVPALEKLHSLTDRYKLKKLRLHLIPEAISPDLKKELLKIMARKKLPQYKIRDSKKDTKFSEWYAIAKFHQIDHSSLLIDTHV